MIRRLFWILIGAALGVYVVRRLSALASGGSLGERARDFGAVVRAGMAEREAELRRALDGEGDPAAARDLLENPMTDRDR